MAGNRGIYNAAMKRAEAHAWKEEWSAALREYQRAAEEFPEDTDARMGIATSYAGLKRWRQALEIYQALLSSAPTDLLLLERLAETYVQVQDLSQAREFYLRLSDQYVLRRQIAQAIHTMQHLSELLPQDQEILSRLAHLHLEAGNRDEAAKVQVEQVRMLFREGRLNEAMALVEEATENAPKNRQAKELLFRLRREMSARREQGEEEEEIAPGAVVSTFQLEQWAREAAERQEQGDLDTAIRLYERVVEGGLPRADVYYSLGLLYKDVGRVDEAIARFQQAAQDDEYALSSHYALGECYRDSGQLGLAAQEFERALHLVDLQSIGREAVDDLIQMYEAAAEVHERQGDLARAASLYTTLSGFLQSKRWYRGETDKFRERAQELTEKSMFAKLRQLGTGLLPAIEERARGEPAREPAELERPKSAIPSLTESGLRPITDFLRPGEQQGEFARRKPAAETPEVKPLEEALAIVPPVPIQLPVRKLDTSGLEETSQELVEVSRIYLERGLFNAALDACCEVIRHAPDYLPIHLRMSEVYERQDRPDAAMSKYQALINTYLARGEHEEAIEVYEALLALAPDAVSARSRLADLLVQLGRVEDAAKQMVRSAQSYFRLGQTNRAVETFREVRALAPNDKTVYLEYGLFLLKMDQPESAIGELRRALQLDTDDPIALVRLNVTLARLEQQTAFWESLATVLKHAQEDQEAHQQIEREYKDALLHQESAHLYYALGLLQRQGDQVIEAIEAFQRAYQQAAAAPVGTLQLLLCRALAEGYLQLNHPSEAIQVLEQGLEWAEEVPAQEGPPSPHDFLAVPTMLSFYHWIAEAYAQAERIEEAIEALTQAKAEHPYDRETSTKLADIYFRQGNLRQALSELNGLVQHYEQSNQLDRALEILQHMSRLAPNNLAVHKRLSHLYIRRGYIERGLEELETLSELQRKRGLIDEAVQSLQQMAEIFWTMGRHDRAYQLYDRIVQLAPNDVSARQQLINLHILAGRLADALEEQHTIAHIALQRRDIEGAIAALHQVLALDPENRDALRELGMLLSSIEEHGQALRLYRRLAKLEPDNAEVTKLLEEEERIVGTQADSSA